MNSASSGADGPGTDGPASSARSPGPAWRTRLSTNFRATIILLVALVAFTAMTVFIKAAGQRIPLVEILTFRQFIMQLLIVPFAIGDLPRLLRTRQPLVQIFRGLMQLGAMVLSFAAVIHLPLAHAMAISFSYAIFVTIGAGVFLKERIGAGRWVATVLGLAGVGLMLRPSGEASLLYSIVATGGAICAAASALSLRYHPAAGGADTVLTYQAIVLLGALVIPTALVWVTPSAADLVLLVLVGITGTAGQWLLTIAYQKGDAAALAPLDFVRLLLTAVCGLVFFGDSLDPWVIAGAAVLIVATAYTFRVNYRPR